MVDDDQKREDERRRAILLSALHTQTNSMAHNLYNQLGGLALPNHRLNGIANSFAWHAQRPTPGARLANGLDEIRRLQKRIDRNGTEYAIYSWLLGQIGAGSRPNAAEQTLLDPLRLADGEVAHWLDRVRLLRAQSLLSMLMLFVQSKRFTDELAEVGGRLQWN